MKINQEVAQVLVSQGLAYSDIGRLFDISRQRVHQILTGYESPQTKILRLNRKSHNKKVSKEERKAKSREHKRSYIKNWHRNNVLIIDGKYVQVKKRPRPDNICEVCERNIERIEYHHWDSNEPELGIWLCKSCHRMAEGVDKTLHNKYLELKSAIQIEI